MEMTNGAYEPRMDMDKVDPSAARTAGAPDMAHPTSMAPLETCAMRGYTYQSPTIKALAMPDATLAALRT